MKHLFKAIAISLLLLAPALSAPAQTTTKRTLTLDGARQVIAAAIEYARKSNAPGGVIAVVDDGGNLMALERLDGTFAAGATISIGKARTAALFKKPTKAFEDIIKNGRTAMTALPDSLFTPLQGGIPIMVDGQIVGGVGVSGASSAQQDEEIAIAGANSLGAPANMDHAVAPSAGKVLVFDKARVDQSFATGAVLIGGTGRNYSVNTSRRTDPGQAEIHTLDTDIFYIVDGNATLRTGGTAVDAKTTEPNEMRGTRIEAGETYELSKGQVVVIPAGVPHWFQTVSGNLLYYTVKVR